MPAPSQRSPVVTVKTRQPVANFVIAIGQRNAATKRRTAVTDPLQRLDQRGEISTTSRGALTASKRSFRKPKCGSARPADSPDQGGPRRPNRNLDGKSRPAPAARRLLASPYRVHCRGVKRKAPHPTKDGAVGSPRLDAMQRQALRAGELLSQETMYERLVDFKLVSQHSRRPFVLAHSQVVRTRARWNHAGALAQRFSNFEPFTLLSALVIRHRRHSPLPAPRPLLVTIRCRNRWSGPAEGQIAEVSPCAARPCGQDEGVDEQAPPRRGWRPAARSRASHGRHRRRQASADPLGVPAKVDRAAFQLSRRSSSPALRARGADRMLLAEAPRFAPVC